MQQQQEKSVSKLRTTEQIITLTLCFLLIAGYICTYFSDYVHTFELLSNFIVQLMLAALVLGIFALFMKNRIGMTLMFSLALICFVQSRIMLDKPWQFSAPQETSTLKIASFNQNIKNENFDVIAEWLTKSGDNYDAVVIIEATAKTKRVANRVKDIFPHQILEHTVKPKKRPISYFILSKYPVLEHERITLSKKPRHNLVVKFKIKPDSAKESYTIYALHTHSPLTEQSTAYRNQELEKVAQLIQRDDSKNIIAIGDFNTAPYSRHFKKFYEISGLNFQSYGLLLNPTWPSQLKMPFLQIPIDHVFYSDTLIQQNKKVEMSLFSDHHALIAEFSEKQ